MKIKIFQRASTELQELEKELNEFDKTHSVKYTQHSTAYGHTNWITVLVFYE